MADAMVTGRMSQAKKQAGNRVLQSLGISASQAINQLYDHLVTQGTMPFASEKEKTIENARLAEALAFARSLPRESRFSSMSDEAIKRDKLASRGFAPGEGGEC